MFVINWKIVNQIVPPPFLHSDMLELHVGWWVGLMVFNATFNNISAISWRSVLLVEENGGPGGNHRPVASH
jgi:hypothetical protein